MFSLLRNSCRSSTAIARLPVIPSIPSRRAYSESAQAPSELDDGERKIFTKLSERFLPSRLQVQDVSGGCGTFYAITIASSSFAGLPIVKQHRLVNDTLKEEISGIHGLQLKTIPESK